MSTEPDLAGVGFDLAGQNAKQGRFAAAGFIVQCDTPCVHAITQALKESVLAVAFAQILESKHE
jgi:hypothetical protein